MDDIEIIDKYLHGELSEEETKIFEDRLKTDIDLQKELDLSKEINESITDDAVYELRKQLIELNKPKKEKRWLKTMLKCMFCHA